jgi:hypothetical protein
MLYKPILDAIKAIIVADETANGLIEIYRDYAVEPGVSKTPVCVIGATTKQKHGQSYLGDTIGSRPRTWSVLITVLILGRSYPTQTQLTLEVEKLDAVQAAVFTVLNGNSKLNSTVTQSLIEDIHDITSPGGEYFGHEIVISIEKKEG